MKSYLMYGGTALLIALGVYTYTHVLTKNETVAPVTVTRQDGTVTIVKDGAPIDVTDTTSVIAPFTVQSNESGFGIVRLSDGSELRIDKNSELTVHEASYNADTRDLMVRAKLTLGRVWSSVQSLATPASQWEVETTNVVATVRGTAFSVEMLPDGKCLIVGSEHTVDLTLIDPDTGTRADTPFAKLGEEETTIVDNEIARGEKEPNQPTPITDEVRNDPWFTQNETRDIEQDATGVDDSSTPDSPDSDRLEEVSEDIHENPTDDTHTPVEPNDDDAPLPIPAPAPRVTPSTQSAETAKRIPRALSLTPSRQLAGIIEETNVSITVKLEYVDGTTRDVTREVLFNVLGEIGSVRDGVFLPRLGPTYSEFGRASGSITATWIDPETGKEFFGSTPIFEVLHKVVPIDPVG